MYVATFVAILCFGNVKACSCKGEVMLVGYV